MAIAPVVEAFLDADGGIDIDAKHAALGGPTGVLGAPVGPEETVGRGRVRRYAKGMICWSPRWEARAVQGAIHARYVQLGGPAGKLGFPRLDEMAGDVAGSRVSYFEHGAIYFSPATGTREVLGPLYVRYQDLDAERGFVGLPTAAPVAVAGGTRQEFRNATLLAASGTEAFEVHGAIRGRYDALGGPAGILGFPLSNETDVVNRGGVSIGKASRFTGGTVYWSTRTGAFEVHGDIRACYEALGGPGGALGFPTSDETRVVTASGETRYNDFEHGIVVWRAGIGARAITRLEFHIGQVSSGSIDDGIEWTGRDKTAELVTYTTIDVNGVSLEKRVRRPGDHAGAAHDINRRFTVDAIRHDSVVAVKVDVDDWDAATGNDWLGTLERRFDIDTWWGLLGGEPAGVYNDLPATKKGGDAPKLDTLRFDLAVGDKTGLDPSKHYRDQRFWRFDNFDTPVLAREQYVATFKDVDNTDSTWDEVRNPFDTAYYELAYKSVAAKGNCFGLSVESLYSLADRSLFVAPLQQHVGTVGDDEDATTANVLTGPRKIINEKHGYQLGASAINWIVGQLTNLDAIRPTKIFAHVQACLRIRDWPVLSMVDIGRGSGHAVVPYKTEKLTDGTCRIYVADPNVVWRQKEGDPTYVEIRPDDTFRYVGGTSVYQSTKILDGRLPGTLLLAIPFHRLSAMPRTPFWEVALALAALTGMVALVAGDAKSSALTVDGRAYQDPDGRIRPGAAGPMARIPFLDATATTLPELYVRRGYTESVAMDLTAKGTGAGEAHVLTHDVGARLQTPARGGGVDHLALTSLGTRAPQAAVSSTKDKASHVQLAKFAEDAPGKRRGERDHVGFSAEVPLAGGRPVTLGFDRARGIVVHGLGADRGARVELRSRTGDRVSKVALDLRPEASDEALRVVVPDPSNLREGLRVERLSGLGGSVIATSVPDVD